MKMGDSVEREQFVAGAAASTARPAHGFPAPPLLLLQPLLGRLVAQVAQREPELFSRLGASAARRFLIDPSNLPFVLLLEPAVPRLTACQRDPLPAHDAVIAGSFLNLFDMIDGTLDGDALFFSRDLRVSGDTEAVVALRNALDDIDGSVLDKGAQAFGPLSPVAAFALGLTRAFSRRAHDEKH